MTMALLAEKPVTVPMYFVRPHVKPGDYYLMLNPITGRRMWVYPRHMGERQYAVTSSLGDDVGGEQGFDISSYMTWLAGRPEHYSQQLEETQQELQTARTLMKVTIAASLIASAVAIMALMRR